MKLLSRVRLLATPWTAAYQAPPSMGFSRQKYWSGVPSLILYYNKFIIIFIQRRHTHDDDQGPCCAEAYSPQWRQQGVPTSLLSPERAAVHPAAGPFHLWLFLLVLTPHPPGPRLIQRPSAPTLPLHVTAQIPVGRHTLRGTWLSTI